MADNRFRGGVHIARQTRPRVGPGVYGWIPGRIHPKHGKIVWRKGKFKLMKHPTEMGWYLQGQGDWLLHLEIDVATISRDMRDICPVCGSDDPHDWTHEEPDFVSGTEWGSSEPKVNKYNLPKRTNERPRRPVTGPKMQINGSWVSLLSIQHFYVCAECYGKIERHNHGIRCIETPEHRGFMTKAEGLEIQEVQQANINKLSEVYKIVGGKVVIK